MGLSESFNFISSSIDSSTKQFKEEFTQNIFLSEIGSNESNKFHKRQKEGLDGRKTSDTAKNSLNDLIKDQQVPIILNENQPKKKAGFPTERIQGSSSKSKFGNRKFGLKINSRKLTSNIANKIRPKLPIGPKTIALGQKESQKNSVINSKFLDLKQTNTSKEKQNISPLIGCENPRRQRENN